jgi:small nuclear ribonucleoprotein
METGVNIGGPLDILKLLINAPVTVELKDSSTIKGLLKGYDEHINLILSKAKSEIESTDILFIRGDLVCLIREG